MAQFKKINTLQIGNRLLVFTDPQIVEWERDENSVTMRAVLRIPAVVGASDPHASSNGCCVRRNQVKANRGGGTGALR